MISLFPGSRFYRILLLVFIISGIFICNSVQATHIRAGEIYISSSSSDPLFFTFTFVGYRDRGSQIEFGGGVFEFGDGNSVERDFDIQKQVINEDIERVEWSLSHRYDGPGPYTVSYKEEFRNADIMNMDNSVNTTFYVETFFVIDPVIGFNNYPVLTVPPIDFAAIGALFIHNPGATDDDGDSLAYRFVTPKQARNQVVNNYRPLNAEEFYSNYAQGSEELTPPKLSLNALTGDLIWNAPGDAIRGGVREYNVAFVVEEWRVVGGSDPFMISATTRDMQIIVDETDNERPELEIPEDICVVAGDTINEIIQGNDPDGDPVKLEAFGGPFEVPNPATYAQTPGAQEFEGPPAFLNFIWRTQCNHVRLRPYEVQFKATDEPLGENTTELVNFETWKITVVGPPPEGLSTAVNGRSMQLNWDNYKCSEADTMQIWRRVGEHEIEADDCVTGMPANSGYELVASIPTSQTSYLDNNNGIGLAPGANYCYRLVAKFSASAGDSYSIVSEEVCDSLILDAPAITKVDIDVTSETDGVIFVAWVPPYQEENVNPPYTYDLLRGEGEGPSDSYELVASGISDTFHIDTGLDTKNLPYNYFVRHYDSGGVLVDSSATASSVRLSLNPLLSAIELQWDANVPWSIQIQKHPYHYIYRDQTIEGDPTALSLIDSVAVTSEGLYYLDNGSYNGTPLSEEIEYCYYVETYGSYDNSIIPEPLINRSQLICAQPNDTIPPCTPPELTFVNLDSCETVASLACGLEEYSNSLDWGVDTDPDCDEDIVYYNIYFSESGLEEDYEVVGTPFATNFTHSNLSSLKGCYRVSAVDRSGNESKLSEEICNDNCPYYALPNVFTPNADGKNDVFAPYNNIGLNISGFDNSQCPRFVESVKMTIYDRTGKEVFRYDSYENPEGIYINWNGKNNIGEELPSGIYYYTANVRFNVLESSDDTKTIKGWVQLLK